MSAALSGRVYQLEVNQSYIDQQLLLRPDMSTFSAYQTVANAQLDAMSTRINTMVSDIAALQNLIINTNIDLFNLEALLTGHMARIATGSSPTTHTGGYP